MFGYVFKVHFNLVLEVDVFGRITCERNYVYLYFEMSWEINFSQSCLEVVEKLF